MGRLKKFSREDVLDKAMGLFWRRGYADTGLQDLEKATGVNKSGLYAEFKDKEDMFIRCLERYYASNESSDVLRRQPLGLANVQAFFEGVVGSRFGGNHGCFGVNCLRELEGLPPKARKLVQDSRKSIRGLIVANLTAEGEQFPAETAADLLMTFFSGLCIEQNLKPSKAASLKRVHAMIQAVQVL